MAAATPEELADAFATAIARGDLDGALAMWGEDAAIVAADGSLVQGLPAIRDALQALLSNGTQVRIELASLVRAGDIALATGSLTLSGEGEGGAFEHRSSSTVVYARGADGRWRIALDAPWGLPAS